MDTMKFDTPTSPRYCNKASPRRGMSKFVNDDENEPETPKTCVSSVSKPDEFEFEFETSSRFDHEANDFETERDFGYYSDNEEKTRQRRRKKSLPTMAFADELFCDGKVMPLKPPPRLQCNQGPSFSPTRPMSSIFKLPFSSQSLWNDDFDPFMVALENVKGYQEQSHGHSHRRARSLSPVRIRNDLIDWKSTQNEKLGSDFCPNQELGPKESPHSIWIPHQHTRTKSQQQEKNDEKSPVRLVEPKGALFARRARLVKVGYEKPKKTSFSGPLRPTEKEEEEEEIGKERKRKKIRKFLLLSGSNRKANEEKQVDENEAPVKKIVSRKFSFKSMRLVKYNDEKRVSDQITKMTLVHYKPRIFLCMGYGAKYDN